MQSNYNDLILMSVMVMLVGLPFILYIFSRLGLFIFKSSLWQSALAPKKFITEEIIDDRLVKNRILLRREIREKETTILQRLRELEIKNAKLFEENKKLADKYLTSCEEQHTQLKILETKIMDLTGL